MSFRKKASKSSKSSKTKSRDGGSNTGYVPALQEALQEDLWDKHLTAVTSELQRIYDERLEPVETRYEYSEYKPVARFSETIKQRKPMALFLGPYSSGKSTFINYLIQNDVLPTGPQPVTDKFTIVSYGERQGETPGRVLLSDPTQPFKELQSLGDEFSEHFCGVTVKHDILSSVTLVDTPGILESAADRRERPYDFVRATRWFIERSDIIFVIFDPTKLDSGPQLHTLFKSTLRGFGNKVRIILNKADTLKPQELMRVYGALFWNIAALMDTSEPPRIYASSFWSRPYKEGTDHKLFSDEKRDLMVDLIDKVPSQALDKRVTNAIRRTYDVLTFAIVCSHYKASLPDILGRSKAKEQFFLNYPTHVKTLAKKYDLSEKVFPRYEPVHAYLTAKNTDLDNIPTLEKLEKRGWIQVLKETAETDLPKLMQPVRATRVADPRVRRNSYAEQFEHRNQEGLYHDSTFQGMGPAIQPSQMTYNPYTGAGSNTSPSSPTSVMKRNMSTYSVNNNGQPASTSSRAMYPAELPALSMNNRASIATSVPNAQQQQQMQQQQQQLWQQQQQQQQQQQMQQMQQQQMMSAMMDMMQQMRTESMRSIQ